MKQLWSWMRRKEWAIAVGVAAAVASEVQHQISDVGAPNWRSLLPIVVGVLTRSGVWSQASHEGK